MANKIANFTLVLFATCSIFSCTTSTQQSTTADKLRLPPHTRPIAYDWKVKVHLPRQNGNDQADDKLFTVEGCVSITLECLEATDRVVLNQKDISIVQNTVTLSQSVETHAHCNVGEAAQGDNLIRPETVTMDNETEMVHIVFGENKLEKDAVYRLQLSYTAPISDKVLRGIYRSQYRDAAGTQRWLATTHMEPVSARRALPLYDEPQLKATFRVAIQHPVGTTALSNSPQVADAKEIGADWLETSFEPTPIMSSYLLAIVVSDFVYTESTVPQSNVKFRVWCRKELVNDTQFAAEIGPKIVAYFNKFYKHPYPLKKLDMIAVPDFAAGAMENWGLITYRESVLLYNEEKDSLRNKIRIANVVAHELAHQWFGNLVTMKWWDDLWLNEGFATYASYPGSSMVDPKQRMDDRLGILETASAKEADQKITSHPLFVPLEKLIDIYENFDSISYDKGSAVIRMIEYVMGSDNLQTGLQKYLTTYKYENANNTNLWDSLSQVNALAKGWDGKALDMRKFAETWTLQKNFPVVIVTAVSDANGMKLYRLHQERFLISNNYIIDEPHKNSPFNYKWHIPVWYDTIGNSTVNKKQFVWLTANGSPVQIGPWPKGTVPLLNHENAAFYRTLYPKEMYSDLANILLNKHKVLDAQTKCMLVDDAFAMAETSRVPYDNVLPLIGLFTADTDNLVIMRTLLPMARITKKLRYTTICGNAKAYMRKLLKSSYDAHAWKSDHTDDPYLEEMRSTVTGLMCSYGDAQCLHKASGIGQELTEQCKSRTLSECNKKLKIYRATAYCGFVQLNDNAFGYLWDKLKVEQSQNEIINIIKGLSCSKNMDEITQLLLSPIKRNVLRKQDMRVVFSSVAEAFHGGKIIFDFVLQNWDMMLKEMGGGFSLRSAVAHGLSNVVERTQIDQLRSFLDATASARQLDAFYEQLQQAQDNADWIERHGVFFDNWFREHNTKT